MKLSQSFKMAFASILSNKMRSFLTMLGVIIGVFAVVVLVSVVQGSTRSVTEELEGMGANTINVSATSYRHTLELSDITDFSEITGVEYCAPILSGSASVRANRETFNASMVCSNADYIFANSLELSAGRNFNDNDLSRRFLVAIVGSKVADEIFGHRDVVGKTVSVNGRTFTIIGVLEEEAESLFGTSNERILIPITTAERLLKTRAIRQIVITALTSDDVTPVKAELEKLMEKKVGKDNYNVIASQQILDTMNSALNTLTLMMGGIAGISLVVGGIGIMNIMLVSVTERTREIGIRKAIGAKRINILSQFLIEAVVITLIGGIIALGLSHVSLIVLGNYMGIEMSMSSDTITLGMGFCVAIGLLFGVYPANKASKLNPIEALRHE